MNNFKCIESSGVMAVVSDLILNPQCVIIILSFFI
jgi:hypothetical protein